MLIPANADNIIQRVFPTALKKKNKRSSFINTPLMKEVCNSEIGKIIKDYIELRDMLRLYTKNKNNLEKEYNKLLANFNGEEKTYTLEQADRIYIIYSEIICCKEQIRIASESFNEAEDKLKEIGRILYEATIHADISLPDINGMASPVKSVLVTYRNGEVDIR